MEGIGFGEGSTHAFGKSQYGSQYGSQWLTRYSIPSIAYLLPLSARGVVKLDSDFSCVVSRYGQRFRRDGRVNGRMGGGPTGTAYATATVAGVLMARNAIVGICDDGSERLGGLHWGVLRGDVGAAGVLLPYLKALVVRTNGRSGSYSIEVLLRVSPPCCPICTFYAHRLGFPLLDRPSRCLGFILVSLSHSPCS